MGKTLVATGNALTKKVWEEKLFRDMTKESYFSKFTGEGQDSIVQSKTNLEKSKGDQITFGLRMRLTGTGVTEGQTLEGNEEDLTTYSHTLVLQQYRHAVKWDASMSVQRAVYDIPMESKDAIKNWGVEKIDQLHFDALLASPTKIFYPSGTTLLSTTTLSTATAAIDATQKFEPKFMNIMRAWAKTGGDRDQIPLKPVKVNGKDYYVCLVGEDVLCDLELDADYQQGLREAERRGPDNPIFTGATAIVGGVVIHSHENMATVSTGGAGSDVPYTKCVFMGQQALVMGYGKRPRLVERDFDYDTEKGVAWDMIMRVNKPVFNSLDYGSVMLVVANGNYTAI